MAKKSVKDDVHGKFRTREHVVADLSVNYVERLVLRCGFSVQRVTPDYGYDLIVDLYKDDGQVMNDNVRVQLKGSDDLRNYAINRESVFSFPVTTKDYRLWSSSLFPVLLILYDAKIDESYWVDVRQLAMQSNRSLKGKTTQIHVPMENILVLKHFCCYDSRCRILLRRIVNTNRRRSNMAIEPMTFEQLRTKLIALGFTQFRIEHANNGKQGWHFEKNDFPNASFYLPDYEDKDIVSNFDLSAILATLKSRGLIEKQSPLLN